MVDFYKNCGLSRFGKDAGIQSMPEFTRNVVANYDKFLSRIKEQKAKPVTNKSEDFGLYL